MAFVLATRGLAKRVAEFEGRDTHRLEAQLLFWVEWGQVFASGRPVGNAKKAP